MQVRIDGYEIEWRRRDASIREDRHSRLDGHRDEGRGEDAFAIERVGCHSWIVVGYGETLAHQHVERLSHIIDSVPGADNRIQAMKREGLVCDRQSRREVLPGIRIGLTHMHQALIWEKVR